MKYSLVHTHNTGVGWWGLAQHYHTHSRTQLITETITKTGRKYLLANTHTTLAWLGRNYHSTITHTHTHTHTLTQTIITTCRKYLLPHTYITLAWTGGGTSTAVLHTLTYSFTQSQNTGRKYFLAHTHNTGVGWWRNLHSTTTDTQAHAQQFPARHGNSQHHRLATMRTWRPRTWLAQTVGTVISR